MRVCQLFACAIVSTRPGTFWENNNGKLGELALYIWSLADKLDHRARMSVSQETTLMFIVRKGWYYSHIPEWAEQLIKCCGQPSTGSNGDLIDAQGPFKETVAHYCARIRDYWFLKALLKYSPDLLITVSRSSSGF